MRKAYSTPQIDIIEFTVEDIITTSAVIQTESPKTFENSMEIAEQTLDIFDYE